MLWTSARSRLLPSQRACEPAGRDRDGEKQRCPTSLGGVFSLHPRVEPGQSTSRSVGAPCEFPAPRVRLRARPAGRRIQPVSESWVMVGRRGEKALIAALAGVFLAAFRDDGDVVVTGEKDTPMCLTADRRQARTVLRYIAGSLDAVRCYAGATRAGPPAGRAAMSIQAGLEKPGRAYGRQRPSSCPRQNRRSQTSMTFVISRRRLGPGFTHFSTIFFRLLAIGFARGSSAPHSAFCAAQPIDNVRCSPNATTLGNGDRGASRIRAAYSQPSASRRPAIPPPSLLAGSIPETTTPRPEPGRVESRRGRAFGAACAYVG